MAALSTASSPWHVHFLQFACYHCWATGCLLDAVADVPEADDDHGLALGFVVGGPCTIGCGPGFGIQALRVLPRVAAGAPRWRAG